MTASVRFRRQFSTMVSLVALVGVGAASSAAFGQSAAGRLVGPTPQPEGPSQVHSGVRYVPPAGWNVYRFCNHQVDAAENDALLHYDRATRKADYWRAQEIVSRNLPIIVLWYQREFDIINTDFKNYKPAHAVTPFWNSWEWSI